MESWKSESEGDKDASDEIDADNLLFCSLFPFVFSHTRRTQS